MCIMSLFTNVISILQVKKRVVTHKDVNTKMLSKMSKFILLLKLLRVECSSAKERFLANSGGKNSFKGGLIRGLLIN